MRSHKSNAIRVRVTLDDIEPPIWRQLIVPVTWHLGQLHLCIQAAFSWWNCHLHEFRVGGLRYGDPDIDDVGFEDDPRVFDEREVRLRDFDSRAGATFAYVYDFGDDWHHTVEIEKRLALDDEPMTATCVGGARARPPEDVGGVGGYQDFLEIMADREHPEHAATKRWCGGYFDPEWFDLALADKDVRNALKPNIRRRMYQRRTTGGGARS